MLPASRVPEASWRSCCISPPAILRRRGNQRAGCWAPPHSSGPSRLGTGSTKRPDRQAARSSPTAALGSHPSRPLPPPHLTVPPHLQPAKGCLLPQDSGRSEGRLAGSHRPQLRPALGLRFPRRPPVHVPDRAPEPCPLPPLGAPPASARLHSHIRSTQTAHPLSLEQRSSIKPTLKLLLSFSLQKHSSRAASLARQPPPTT